MEFLYLGGKYYPNISKNILLKILKNIGMFVLMGLAIFIVPKGELRLKIIVGKKRYKDI